jgi:hypothetical protein
MLIGLRVMCGRTDSCNLTVAKPPMPLSARKAKLARLLARKPGGYRFQRGFRSVTASSALWSTARSRVRGIK